MDLTVKTAPTGTTISLDLLKTSKRIRHNSEDAIIEFWIKAADDYIERRTNRALMEQTLVLRLSRILPCIEIPRPPLVSISHIKYTPKGGDEVTVDAGDITTTNRDMIAQATIAGLTEKPGTMEIEYVAGASNADDVPSPLRQASMLLAGHYMTSREATFLDPRIMNVEKKIEFGVDQNCLQYRVPNLAELNGGY